MYNLGMVMIGGSGGVGNRSSLFSASVMDNFGVAGYNLGQNDAQQYYVDAKNLIAEFDQLAAIVPRISAIQVRNQIASDYGLNDPTDKDKAMYMRNALASDVANAEKYTPIAYEQGFPTHGPARGRVTKLRNFIGDFRGAVKDAEAQYSLLPTPQVIEKTVTVPGGGTNWTIPLVVAGGGIAVAALLGVFSGK